MVQPLRSRLDSKTQREQPMKPLLEIEWNENIRKVIAPLPSTVIIGGDYCVSYLRVKQSDDDVSQENLRVTSLDVAEERSYTCGCQITALAWSDTSTTKRPCEKWMVAAACADRSIRLLDADVAEIGVFTGHKDYINDLAFSYSPEQLDPLLASVSGSAHQQQRGHVHRFGKIPNIECYRNCRAPNYADDLTCRLWYADGAYNVFQLDSQGVSVHFHPSYRFLLVSSTRTILVVDFESHDTIFSFHPSPNCNGAISSVDWSDFTGSIGAVAGNYYYIWNLNGTWASFASEKRWSNDDEAFLVTSNAKSSQSKTSACILRYGNIARKSSTLNSAMLADAAWWIAGDGMIIGCTGKKLLFWKVE